MQSLVLLGLLGSSALAHPAVQSANKKTWKPTLSKRLVDLDQFRPGTVASYVNATETSSSPETKLIKRDDFVATATALVKSKVPDTEFRVYDSYISTNGIGHVYFRQTIFGLDVDNTDFNVNIAKDGSIFSHGNSFYTGALPESSPLMKRGFKDPVAALNAANSILQLDVKADGATAEAKDGVETYNIVGTTGAQSDPEARLLYFVKDDGTLALTWRIETDISSDWLLSYVDAETAEKVHGVVNYVARAHEKLVPKQADISATYLVYPWGVNDPDEGSREVVKDPWVLKDSPFTWHNDGTKTYDTTWGNNAAAQVNPTGATCDTCYTGNYRPESPNFDFEYDYSPSMADPESYYNASVTQLFYSVNTYHDLLYELGFTESTYNFQTSNDGKGGQGSDFAIVNAQDGAGTNNADFSTPADGRPGRMRMYLWTESTPVRDCAFEAGVVIHEYTHGVSNRLTGGGTNTRCLTGVESGGMGEGWGDFMATAIRLKETDTRATDYSMGAWVYNNPAGIRAYLFSTDMTTNPYTYTSVNGKTEVHSVGTIWTTILYEVLWNLIDKHGFNAAAKPTFDSAGVPTDGRYLAMKLVIDGMSLQPCNPTMVSARDAIIDADLALTGGANACELWTGFAKRGLGQGAVYNSSRRTESFVVPSGVC
ncbi:hypothetical protein KVR01_008932 [Diaporthe batatas]|uniref:uncharacterized protein n=1 Tax=Diaporthe batatas TaxID=748121 RepID=UPI001D052381|nr:uncharacterized protein KVR01_008932 [Diaporthe batatas]KAG8160668.1 hypothetical protein KVR01_008932 [Diaporthe batatas]